jgi:hypothetical protein
MTLNVSYKPAVLEGNGIIKEFSYSFNPISENYIRVSLEQDGKWVEQLSGWSATTSENGGVVTFDVAPDSRVAIERIIPKEQPTSYTTSSGFQAKVVENSFDILTGMVQQLQEESDRSVKVVVGDDQTPEELLAEVYGKLDSATDIAKDAILAAEQATIAAEQATTSVEEAKKQVIDTQEYVDQAKGEIDDAIRQATDDVKQAALDAAQESINTAAEQAVAIVEDYANNEVKPELMAFVASADEDSVMASESAEKSRKWAEGSDTEVTALGGEHSSKTWSGMAKQYATSAQGYASSSESSARVAQTAASQASQSSGRVIQLGFDGALSDGKLVFKHAPSGVEIPYSLLDDYEYEVDLLWDSDVTISQNTPMVIKNGSDIITFVSALHRSADEPATMSDMSSVMRQDNGSYRWLFKAAYKITPAGKKVFLLYPVAATSITITYED